MKIANKKAPDALAGNHGAHENIQVQDSMGFESCQSIETIKEELERLEEIMKRTGNADAYSRSAVRYWAIRWVMGWEKEIPEDEKND